MITWACLASTALIAFAEGDAAAIAKLLDAALAAEQDARRPLLKQAIDMMGARKVSPAERARLSHQMVEVLRNNIATPADVRALFPPERLQVSRQIYYGRFREQWRTDFPVAVRIVFDCAKGKDPVLQTVELVGR